jgi:hypothetical protein
MNLTNQDIDLDIEILTELVSSLSINNKTIIKIQSWYRGCIFRLKQLPLIMYKLKKYLQLQVFQFSNQTEDGRINSCIDEDGIINLLIKKFGNKIKKPNITITNIVTINAVSRVFLFCSLTCSSYCFIVSKYFNKNA